MTTSDGDEEDRRAVGVTAANCGAGAEALVTSDRVRFGHTRCLSRHRMTNQAANTARKP